MSTKPDWNMRGANAGKGMLFGAAAGLIFTPFLGPFSLVIGAGAGLLIGMAICRPSDG
jgi:uncharacterized membrane protein